MSAVPPDGGAVTVPEPPGTDDLLGLVPEQQVPVDVWWWGLVVVLLLLAWAVVLHARGWRLTRRAPTGGDATAGPPSPSTDHRP